MVNDSNNKNNDLEIFHLKKGNIKKSNSSTKNNEAKKSEK